MEDERKDEEDEDPGIPERRRTVEVVVVIRTTSATQQCERVDDDDAEPDERQRLDASCPVRNIKAIRENLARFSPLNQLQIQECSIFALATGNYINQ